MSRRLIVETQESIEEVQLEVSDGEDDEEVPPAEPESEAQAVVENKEASLAEPPASSSSSSSEDDVEDDETSAYPDTQVTYSEAQSLPITTTSDHKRPPKPPPQPQRQESAKSNTENQPLKRGQRARLKKMKEKYKDQDEEDRQVRMQLLGSAGNEAKKKQQQLLKDKKKPGNKEPKKKPEPAPRRPPPSATASALPLDEDEVEAQEDEEEKAKRLSEDARLFSTLTGQPTGEDPLTNVIGVCAPWVTLNNYKYKVKILPGGLGKKGKSTFFWHMSSFESKTVRSFRCASGVETLCFGSYSQSIREGSHQNREGSRSESQFTQRQSEVRPSFVPQTEIDVCFSPFHSTRNKLNVSLITIAIHAQAKISKLNWRQRWAMTSHSAALDCRHLCPTRCQDHCSCRCYSACWIEVYQRVMSVDWSLHWSKHGRR